MATEIAKAYVQIIPSTDGIAEGIKNELAPEMGKAGETSGNSFAKNFGSKLKVALAGTAIAGAAATGKLISESIEAGAAIQQSFGGLDTIYGDAAEAAKSYAIEAAAAGISANDYAEQAVSFGASLKQAFGGDTAKAAEAANTAILDMADNAAKMGTDLSSIQNAYQGFAKGNYTMLDNLKLGYGGTQAEMERLLADATKLTGVKYDISNLGDVYDAIHAVQEDLGLTGVAAAEASETFSGSLGAMKAAWENVLGILSTGQGDVQQAFGVLSETIVTFVADNAIPMITNLLTAVISNLPEIIRSLVAAVPQIVRAIANAFTEPTGEMIDAGKQLIAGLASGIWERATNLWNEVVEWANSLLSGIKKAFGIRSPSREFAEIGEYLMLGLSKGIESNTDTVENALSAVEDITLDSVSATLTANVNGAQAITGAVHNRAKEGVSGRESEMLDAIYAVGNAVIGEIRKIDRDVYMDGRKVTDIVTKNQRQLSRAMGV